MIPNTYKWHPQPSSLRKATEAARLFDVRGEVVLDCFCGTATHCLAALNNGAAFFIGTDIEDYNFCLRSGISKLNKGFRIETGVDALKAVSTYDYDCLFIDPPNPYLIAGGSLPSVVRDTGLSGSQIGKFWAQRFDGANMINKKGATLYYTKSVVENALYREKRCLVNLFQIRSNKFDYVSLFRDHVVKQVYESYYEVL